MDKTIFIARHEFIITVRRRAFIILTLAFPVLALLGIFAAQVIPGLIQPAPVTTEKIGYIDEVGMFTEDTTQGNINLIPFTNQADALQALLAKDVKEYFIITPDYVSTGLVQRYTLTKELQPSPESQVAIRGFLLNNLLKGNSPEIINHVETPLNMVTITLTSTGEVAPQQGGFTAFILPYFFGILLVISIFFSSSYLLQGLVDEKENRVMEILLSSVSPFQLLAGKVIGLGAVGLTQIVVWLISFVLLARIASSSFSSIIGVLQVSPELIILSLVYFILGYLLLAVAMAGVGAISPTVREGQQLSALFTVPVIIPIYFMPFIMEHPTHIVTTVLTFIPFTAPITVIVRLGLSSIPVWELAVSILLMVATIAGCFILATKLFRTYLLMYGKRPNFGEIMQSFRKA